MAKHDKRASCSLCKDAFDRCSECMEASKKLKLKYRLGQTPGRITAKARTGSSKTKHRPSSRHHVGNAGFNDRYHQPN